MAGLYIHIPFCKAACHYCDFHFSVNRTYQSSMVDAIIHELKMRQSEIGSEKLQSIYFGGGTPSLLTEAELNLIFEQIYRLYRVDDRIEITLEANPDDLNEMFLSQIFHIGINRLSIGIQTFNNTVLKKLNRQHTGKQAIETFYNARKAGFQNISLDLIYGIPDVSLNMWEQDVIQMMELFPEHMSAYCLTIEEKTVFGRKYAKGQFLLKEEENSIEEYLLLKKIITEYDYEQYEISNFARNQKYAIHNSSYWKEKPYLGVGPGAHSYNLIERKYNISSNQKYIALINKGENAYSIEPYSTNSRINDKIITSLRTKWGLDLSIFDQLEARKSKEILKIVQKYVNNGHVLCTDNIIYLTESGKLYADMIASDLFLIE